MSTGLTATAQIEFDAGVKAAYQGMGVLRPTVRVKTGVVGSSEKFRRYNKGVATPRVPQTDVVPMGTTYATVTATLADWNAPEYTDVFDEATTNVNEREVVQVNIAGAITRREDQLIIDALEANAGSPDVAKSVGGADTSLNTAKLRMAKRILDQRGVPTSDRCFLHNALSLEGLLGTTDATSADFNTVKTLVAGEINTWLGFKFQMIEDRDEGGLLLAANTRSNFAYHRQATGLAIGIDFRTEVNYVPEKTSWLANGLFKAGAVVIDPKGVVEVATHEA
jgi:hypothetical protein